MSEHHSCVLGHISIATRNLPKKDTIRESKLNLTGEPKEGRSFLLIEEKFSLMFSLF